MPTAIAAEGRYAELQIELLRSARVVAIDVRSHVVAIVDEDARRLELRYSKLLLATGGRARTLTLAGAPSERVLTLRSLADARLLGEHLNRGARIAVIGGGFIGLEVAASARQRGCDVSVIESNGQLLGRSVGAGIAMRVKALHEAHGVQVFLNAGIGSVSMNAEGTQQITLASGERIAADLILVGIGMTPDTDLARGAGLDVGRGILVSADLRTSAPDVFAAGDVCEFPHPFGAGTMTHESWANAEAQGALVARSMLGKPAVFKWTPWVWSDQYDHTLQVVGFTGEHTTDRPLDRGVLEFQTNDDGVLVGAIGFAPTATLAKPFLLARRLVESRGRFERDSLADPTVNLKTLLSSAVDTAQC
jgi:3-phenylpropionate/trans-cinnamate dioxygenase ferredoxin reductase subunit